MQDNAAIYNNTATNAGGGVYASYATLTMRDNAEVSGNRVTGDYATGGGVYAFYHAGFTMRDNAEISGNTATGADNYGGEVLLKLASYVFGAHNAELWMWDNASVHGKRTSGNGGGVLVDGYTGNAANSGLFRISGGIISGNTGVAEQQNTVAQGAALYIVPAVAAQRGT
jgi:hypothetical protein